MQDTNTQAAQAVDNAALAAAAAAAVNQQDIKGKAVETAKLVGQAVLQSAMAGLIGGLVVFGLNKKFGNPAASIQQAKPAVK